SRTDYIRIDESLPVDSSVLKFIQPYSEQLSATMNRVIGESALALNKAKPESTLGNFFTDALREQSEKYFERKIDLCVMNYGGLRLPNISAGNITVGTIFELMPFDNYLVLFTLKGEMILQLLQHIAADGGWPQSGVRFTIKEGKPFDITINGNPIQPEKEYTLLVSDYMAEGGDKLDFIK